MASLIAPGETAPDFSLPDLQGITHSLRQYSGKIVLINFWSAECPWVERADAALLPKYAAWMDRITWLSIASNAHESRQELEQTAKRRALPVVLLDPNQQAADLYHVQITPHFFVVDEAGILRYQGAFDDVTFRQRHPTRGFLIQAVEALLQGKLPDPAQTAPYGCTIIRSG